MPPFYREVFIDPRTDYGFKHLFGKEANKELLIALINALLQGERTVVDLRLLPTEHLPKTYQERNAVFDVYCSDENGNTFIVEMQNAYQDTFKARSVYYSTFPIQEGIEKGSPYYSFPAVYTICLLNFKFRDQRDNPDDHRYITRVKLCNLETHDVFFDGLAYIYVELPKFDKEPDELKTDLEKWIYVLSNMSNLMERPVALQARVFRKLFKEAEIAMLDPQQLRAYERDRMALRDIIGITDTAHREGYQKGVEEGMEKGIEKGMERGVREGTIAVARAMKHKGVAIDVIVAASGLSREEVEAL